MARSLSRWLERHAPRGARGTVSVGLVTDARMRVLNRTFRGLDKATDVLSFPSSAEPSPVPGVERPTFRPAGVSSTRRPSGVLASRPRIWGGVHLGDLAIALGVAARQARAQGHELPVELRILALHGLLHLMGYDHERDRGTMRTLEDRLRRRAGLPVGLITRTPARPLHR